MILITIKDKKTGQIYEPNKVFHVTGVILTRTGRIFKIKVYNNNTGTYQTRCIDEFDVLKIAIK